MFTLNGKRVLPLVMRNLCLLIFVAFATHSFAIMPATSAQHGNAFNTALSQTSSWNDNVMSSILFDNPDGRGRHHDGDNDSTPPPPPGGNFDSARLGQHDSLTGDHRGDTSDANDTIQPHTGGHHCGLDSALIGKLDSLKNGWGNRGNDTDDSNNVNDTIQPPPPDRGHGDRGGLLDSAQIAQLDSLFNMFRLNDSLQLGTDTLLPWRGIVLDSEQIAQIDSLLNQFRLSDSLIVGNDSLPPWHGRNDSILPPNCGGKDTLPPTGDTTIDTSGSINPVGNGHIGQVGVSNNVISANSYPNPFSQTTTFNFLLSAADNVTLAVYSTNGVKIATLINGEAMQAGSYSVPFNSLNLQNGTYFYSVQTSTGVTSKTIAVMR